MECQLAKIKNTQTHKRNNDSNILLSYETKCYSLVVNKSFVGYNAVINNGEVSTIEQGYYK